ncbi:hypothetical protein [Streptomyces sp. AM 3-1-1]|uniref:hypothetical protein n=1 Tax=Streptomyces sp. AM 3-1-1 TaxID=3028711 RepID=UPI0023B9C3E0|nr:hypothetical protein [Streptomyces sp. AM 3-1-1]WEH31620.1 hypothetical protein P0D76_10345 [Streptomyces sp. AM 3-1-1]
MIHFVPLAEVDADKVTPGLLGFVVFAVMAAGVWALMKSMNRHMRKVDFKEPEDPSATENNTAETSTTKAGTTKAGTTKAGTPGRG